LRYAVIGRFSAAFFRYRQYRLRHIRRLMRVGDQFVGTPVHPPLCSYPCSRLQPNVQSPVRGRPRHISGDCTPAIPWVQSPMPRLSCSRNSTACMCCSRSSSFTTSIGFTDHKLEPDPELEAEIRKRAGGQPRTFPAAGQTTKTRSLPRSCVNGLHSDYLYLVPIAKRYVASMQEMKAEARCREGSLPGAFRAS